MSWLVSLAFAGFVAIWYALDRPWVSATKSRDAYRWLALAVLAMAFLLLHKLLLLHHELLFMNLHCR